MVLALGCTSGRTPAPSSSEAGSQARSLVEHFIAGAAETPKLAASELTLLLESLESYAEQYRGQHVQVRDAARELKAAYDRSAPEAEVKEQLDQLAQAAAALTG